MCYSCDPQLPGKKQERETTKCEDLKDRCSKHNKICIIHFYNEREAK